MRENFTSSCVSSKGWRVEWETKPTEARVRRLVAWIAGRRETKFLKPIDGIIFRMMAEPSGRKKVNAEVAESEWPQRPSPQR